MTSPQTLALADRRLVASWAADCAEHVLPLFENEVADDERPRAAIAKARAFARGELSAAEGIATRFASGPAARDLTGPAAAAARSAGQAAAVPHMGAHALGAAAYAAKAVALAAPDNPKAALAEADWQLAHLSGAGRAALCQLPLLGTNRSGPLGTGLLSQGVLGVVIQELQGRLHDDG